ncbi:thioredoxin family protein [Sediminibacterium soli]|uniref:thioredoxin family protein n=1 Tax=Sediminibacterium soli TaxID=2698829 RepID=UPI00137A2CCF|nr:thioredoxin family protein [Sediminibacterium soli]NCI46015.1 thioredoxin family protein [Sediminibacterium soli]
MKTVIAAVLFLLTGSVLRAQQTSLALGSQIPMAQTEMKDISGKEVSLNDARLKNGLLVMFSCNTCPYVMKNRARTRQLAAFAKQHQIGVILLNSNEGGRDDGDSFADMQAYAKTEDYRFYYVLDKESKMANAFGASRTPEVYLFDAADKLQYKGAIDDNPANAGNVKRNHAREAILEMAAGKPVTVKESRSMGCGIKRS